MGKFGVASDGKPFFMDVPPRLPRGQRKAVPSTAPFLPPVPAPIPATHTWTEPSPPGAEWVTGKISASPTPCGTKPQPSKLPRCPFFIVSDAAGEAKPLTPRAPTGPRPKRGTIDPNLRCGTLQTEPLTPARLYPTLKNRASALNTLSRPVPPNAPVRRQPLSRVVVDTRDYFALQRELITVHSGWPTPVYFLHSAGYPQKWPGSH
eukprot:TRINITY_DN2492_c0_g1_i4.p1 TRINITY_DN2492_c0_g1~~TRINITY_DN2492_c0_g1_i4.p1  ORF type:complete len:206 (-),score=5.34 TRINITY_DN2492_c0_g1_i4:569-1186(-)